MFFVYNTKLLYIYTKSYIYILYKIKKCFLFIILSCYIFTQIVIYKELYIHTLLDINIPVSGHIISYKLLSIKKIIPKRKKSPTIAAPIIYRLRHQCRHSGKIAALTIISNFCAAIVTLVLNSFHSYIILGIGMSSV